MFYYHLCQCQGKYHTNYAKFLQVVFKKRDDWKMISSKNKAQADYCDCPLLKEPKIEDRFLALAWFTKKNYLAKLLFNTDFYPKTYQKIDNKLYQLNDLNSPININNESNRTLSEDEYKWFVKPNFDHSGNKIKIYKSLSESYQKASDGMVIQQGIEPKLIKGRKFDLRLYAIGIVDNGSIKFYLYHNGYCRLSSKKYNPNKMDRNSNLTNISVHIKLTNPQNTFIFYKKWNGYSETFPQIMEISKELFSRLGKDLEKNYKGVIVMGLDIIIDKEGKPYILEINNKLGSKLAPYSQEFRNMHNKMYGQMINLLFPNTGNTSNWKFLVEV